VGDVTLSMFEDGLDNTIDEAGARRSSDAGVKLLARRPIAARALTAVLAKCGQSIILRNRQLWNESYRRRGA
jgi:hypothetical protein